ncbi:ATP synthase F1 subunit epsilon [Enterobacteriaceae endosymbiont of Plateumaris consimilis]|uniref:ATP synthase F1 subunit epsilon n=1 Tax=Enterobacteriaceae endosymbiont of Plateumaris consimilis TaxID=2675794 RepID=UPI001448F84C|nr:ATP synthase F1 subunit epsilon [Enterobacteriaceae endosymbiont of Plateumaris consimilis]QJC28800.1 ATP synthase F1 subunit epsilon [Enterobacteriaceae endosymbiont of Plateumaris consimilis]
MHKEYILNIISIEKKIFSDLVKKVKIPGIEGYLSIYPNHIPLLTLIKPGVIYIAQKKNNKYFYISGGILEIKKKQVNVLADIVIKGTDLKEKIILINKSKIEKKIKNNVFNKDYLLAIKELYKIIAQLKTVQLTKKNNE